MSKEKVVDLIDELVTYFDLKSYDVINVEERGFLVRLSDLQLSIRNENTTINVTKTFWVFWRTNEMSELRGNDETDAFRKAGYGSGATRAVDFIMEKPEGVALLQPITVPDHSDDESKVWLHYLEGLDELVLMRLGTNDGQGIVECIEKMRVQRSQLKTLYPNRGLTEAYNDWHDYKEKELLDWLEERHWTLWSRLTLQFAPEPGSESEA